MAVRANQVDRDRRHERNHARNLHRGFPHKKLRYQRDQRKSAVQVIPHFFLNSENFVRSRVTSENFVNLVITSTHSATMRRLNRIYSAQLRNRHC
jgi:hypothetical protein